MKIFEDVLTKGLNLGEKYLTQEVLENGNQAPGVRPDTEQVPSKLVRPTAAQMQTQKTIIIAGSVVAGVALLALLVKVAK